MDFVDPAYLKTGNLRQQQAYQVLAQSNIFAVLEAYHPVLVGTIPIAIDVPGSDLDIVCEVHQPVAFIHKVEVQFGHLPGFAVQQSLIQQLPTVIIRFYDGEWPFELFGQPIPAMQQAAYQHMVIEYRILQGANAAFRKNIRQLKQEGVKTEPAFASLLQRSGDPYEAMLALASFSDTQLHRLLAKNGYET